jgi:hypothetical protein
VFLVLAGGLTVEEEIHVECSLGKWQEAKIPLDKGGFAELEFVTPFSHGRLTLATIAPLSEEIALHKSPIIRRRRVWLSLLASCIVDGEGVLPNRFGHARIPASEERSYGHLATAHPNNELAGIATDQDNVAVWLRLLPNWIGQEIPCMLE